MSEADTKQEIEEEVLQEETSEVEEESSYEDAFEEAWGDKTPPKADEEPEVEEEVDEEDGDTEVEAEAPEPESKSNDPYAWINDLPEEVQEQARALRHSADSSYGRATAFQRRSEELQRELDRTRRSRQTAPADTSAKASAPAAPELPEKFKQLKEDFPDFAEAVEAIRAYDRDQWNSQLEERLQPLQQDRAVKKLDDFKAAVTVQAERIFNTKETDVRWEDVVSGEDFRAWLDMQPKSVQKAARTPDPAEAVYVLERYEDDYQRAVKEMEANAPKPAAEESEQDPPKSRAKQLKESREQRQRKAVSQSSKTVPTDSDANGDYEAMFNQQWGGK